MLDGLLRALLKGLLSLRYRVRVVGLEQIMQRGQRGIFFLPNHPALIDPLIVLTQLHQHFRPRPLADQDQVARFPVSLLARWANARPVADMAKLGSSGRQQVEKALLACADDLRAGQNVLIYPSGHLYRSRYEDLRGNSAMETVLRGYPQARVVLVRTRGLWGSSFSMIDGKFPNLPSVLRRAVQSLLANFVFLTPRRTVTIELSEPADFPRDADRNAMNAFVERWYNDDAPPARYVPYTIWERGAPRDMPDPQGAQGARSVDVPESTRKLVIEQLRTMTGESDLRDERSLARDLGMDSLTRAELQLWLGKEFGFYSADAAALQTVGDVLLAARGQAAAGRAVELKPPAAAWFRERSSVPVIIPPGAHLLEVFLRQAARRPDQVILADQISGVRTYRDLITAILVLRPLIAALPGERIGIMLPAGVGAATVYLATLFAGRVPVMLNWTTGLRGMQEALRVGGVQRVLTAAPLLARLASQGTDVAALGEAFLPLEKLTAGVTTLTKLRAKLTSYLSWAALRRVQPAPTAVVLLTSGSEAAPKAVPLTHRNILANVRDVSSFVTLRENDRLLGFLPPFHSFGITVTTLLPLLCGIRTVYHANPTEPWVLAGLIETYRATLLVGTPTFLSSILRSARAGQLKTLRLAVTGAEKCPQSTYDALQAACPGALVLEGYGVTECSPVVAANSEDAPRPGTIGKLLPRVEGAVVDAETCAQRVPQGRQGMLLVRGETVFDGYLGDAASPFVEFEGKFWYRTGDLVSQDHEGVLTFHGRLKRFIKLGGEMISLPAIEAVLEPHFPPGEDGPQVAIDAAGTDEHPEIVLYSTIDTDRSTVNRLIRDAHLSPLHNVGRVQRVAQIPLLGTGKVNYRALKDAPAARSAAESAG